VILWLLAVLLILTGLVVGTAVKLAVVFGVIGLVALVLAV
jgi:hypothetical protein